MVYVSTVEVLRKSQGSATIKIRFWKRSGNKKKRNVWFKGTELISLEREVRELLPDNVALSGGAVQYRTPLGWRSSRLQDLRPTVLTSDGVVEDEIDYDKFATAVWTITVRKK